MKKIDHYGKTDKEQTMNLHDYNHALFQNNVFFMNSVWEINMLTGTVVVLLDKNEPDAEVREYLYEDLYRDYKANKIMDSEQELFDSYMAWENLQKLEKEIFFDLKRHQKNGDWDLYRIVLTPAFDENGRLYCVYLGSRNLQTEIAKEIRQREALKEAYEAANRANRGKSEFIARISDDIRTPMNAIIGMTAIAGKHLDNQERIDECLKRISQSSKYLLGLVDEMIDMSMIESGKMEFQESEVNLSELFDNLCVLLDMRVAEHGHKLTAFLERLEHKMVYGDRRRIDQIIINLVDNSSKYTLENGRINLTMREIPIDNPGSGCYEIVIEDNGIGMQPEFLEHIFEPFVRADDRRVEKVPGSGLGLAITKSIISMMDGSIRAESQPELGSKFTVRIYLRLAKEETEKTAEENGKQSVVERFTTRNFSGHRALIVEDNESNAEILKEILQMTGLEIENVWNGKEAVDKLAVVEDGYYDIIFMDIVMPMMDGYEAVSTIRATNRKYLKEIPIIAMSANSSEKDVQKSLAVGMNEYLTKPVDLWQLERVLSNIEFLN